MNGLKGLIQKHKQEQSTIKALPKKYLKNSEKEILEENPIEGTKALQNLLNKDNNNNNNLLAQNIKKYKSESSEQQVTKKPEKLLTKEEVIAKLRERGEVVTYFGESDVQRALRWKKVEEKEMMENLEENVTKEYQQKKANPDDQIINQDVTEHIERLTQKLLQPDLSKEEFCFYYLKKILNMWNKDILNDPASSNTILVTGKTEQQIFKDCKLSIKPLLKKLRTRKLPLDILDSIHDICKNIERREYVKANDAYMTVAVGNAAWPMGVTMVGIHERSAREKISSGATAHVLNDETARLYLQAVKRMVSWMQKKFPPDDIAKMVDFRQ